jgi:hypothetical protein
LKALLWLVVAVGALFAGMAIQRQLDRPVPVGRARAEVHSKNSIRYVWMEIVRLPDGTEWQRLEPDGAPADEAADPGANSVSSSRSHLRVKLP